MSVFPANTTNVILPITPIDVNDNAIEGLAYNTSGLVIERMLPTDSDWTELTLETMTAGTYASSGDDQAGFVGVDAGDYQLSLPSNIINAGSYTKLRLTYAANPSQQTTVYFTAPKIDVSGNVYAFDTSGNDIPTTADIEQSMVNAGDGTDLLQLVADKLASDLTVTDVTALAIATATRDVLLDRVLAGNHDTAGTVGLLLQFLDAAISSAAGLDAAATRAALGLAAANLDGQLGAIPKKGEAYEVSEDGGPTKTLTMNDPS